MTRGATTYLFGPFKIDSAERVLFENGQPLAVKPKALQTLLMLLERQGHLVEKTELLDRVWPGAVVEEAVLSQNIFLLRKQLRETDDLKYIETVSKRGYRFVADVQRLSNVTGQTANRRATDGRVVLVVLPFENLTGSSDREYLADGLTESIITQLGKLNPDRLGVIARTSAMAYKGSRKTVRNIADELNAQYALEGGVRLNGDRLLISLQLIRAADQCQMFAKQYEQAQTDALGLHDDFSQAIADEVRIRLNPRTSPVDRTRAIDPNAHDQYLRGRYYWGFRSPDAVAKAIEHFDNAIKIDPNYAAAHSGLAVCWGFRSLYSGLPPTVTFPVAKQAAQRALQLDDNLSEAHSMLGICLAMFDFEWQAGEHELRRAIELEPNSSVAHHWYALFLGFMARAEEGLQQAEAAVALDPHSPAIRVNYGLLHDFCGRKFLCIDTYEKIVAQHPNYHICRIMLGTNLCKVGKVDAGIEHLKIAHEHSGKQPDGLAHLGLGYALVGQPDKAREMLAAIQASGGPASAYYIARIHAQIGELDSAFACLDRAYQEHSILMMAIRSDSWLEPLHGDARYAALVQRMRFPDA